MSLIPIAYAASIPELDKIKQFILNPIIVFLMAVALVYFLYGVVTFVWEASKGKITDEGKQHMIWGIIGLAIMVSAWGIVNLALGTINLLAS